MAGAAIGVIAISPPLSAQDAQSPPEQIDILAVGEYQNYRGEILRQEPEAGEDVRYDTRIKLEVGFYSAVDQMPYQFFYGMHGITESTGEWEDKATYRHHCRYAQ